jgi:hypothetical protein
MSPLLGTRLAASCLVDLAVGCGQGFYLGRPELGPVEPRIAALTAG